MKTQFYLFAGMMFCLFAVNIQPSCAQGFSPKTQSDLQHIIDSFQNDPANPYIGGLSVAIDVDGLALWKSATGYAARNVDEENNLLPGGTPFTTDTLSRIYSVTKTFTAALTLELAKRHVFSLDEPIINYLPLLTTVNPSLDASVTIRQLLAHESGYSDYTEEMNLQVAVAFDPTHIWTPYEMVSYVHQLVPPGTQRKYSSTNYVLLGAIIEAATNKPVEALLRKGFFDRLNLSSMYFGGRESIGNRGSLASPHDNISAFNPIFQATGQPTFPDAYTNISRFPLDGIVSLAFTGGAIVSNVTDMAEWGNALFGGRATSKSTIDTMINSVSDTVDEDGDKLGYGVIVSSKISETDYFIGHDGRAPGYRAIMFYQPDRKMTIAIETNYYGADLYAVAKQLYAILPSFLCGNDNKSIEVCFKGKALCLQRNAAKEFIQKGAYLGACDQPVTPLASTNNNGIITDRLFVFPNPVSGNATISFSTVQSGKVSLNIYDLAGNLKASLFNGLTAKEVQQQVRFHSGNLNAGVYMCRLQTTNGITLVKIMVNK